MIARSSRLFAALAFAALGFGSSAALAQSAAGVQHSQGVYHKAVCPGPVAAGNARCHAHVVTDSAGNPIVTNANSGPSGYWPADLRAAYAITGGGSSGTTIAIVDAYSYPNAEADLAVYRSRFGLPACTTANGCFKKVNQTGGTAYPRLDTGWAQETALDLDMASAMCPNCKLLLVEATSATLANLATAENTAASLGAAVISNSYGGSESGSKTYEGAYNHAGVAITVSTGDSGYGVQFPASSPHVTAVGGTTLQQAVNVRGWTETAWSGAGSGCSTVYDKPSWQVGVVFSCTKRAQADVSAVANPATGVAVYGPGRGKGSGWLVFGGTSVSAPLIGGIYAVNGGSATYGSDPYAHTSALNDITSGSNGSCGGSSLCTAQSGWDGPTGLGTPIDATAF